MPEVEEADLLNTSVEPVAGATEADSSSGRKLIQAETDAGKALGSRDAPSRVSARLHPLVELTMVRVREFLREPEAVFWVFVFPVLLTCALGIAFSGAQTQKVPIGVETTNVNAASTQRAIEALGRSPDIQVVAPLSPAEATQQLQSGQVVLVVRSSSSSSDDAMLSDGAARSASFSYRFDPTQPESRAAQLMVDDLLQRAFGRQDVVSNRIEAVSGAGSRYIDFLVPGLIGLNLMGSGMWGLGFAVVQARTKKVLKRFAATPMRRRDYLLSFMLSRLVFLTLEVAAILGFAWLAFDVTVRGRMLDLVVILILGGIMFAGLGLLLAARTRTIEGVSGLMNFVMLPMWIASGTFFSSSRFPESLQPLIQVLPLTALNDALRSVMNNGESLLSVWQDVTLLAMWSIVSFVAALRLFRWQ